MVAEAKIPGTKVGKQWRFAKTTIDKWLEGRTSKSASVLVVEDDSMIRELMINTLKEAGHKPTGADSVARSQLLLNEVEFDLILLDLLLPDGTGLDVVETATQLAAVPEIVVITGHPEHELIADIHRLLPFTTVLNKPVRLATLLELVARATSIPRPAASD